MSLVLGLAIYAILWWLVFFAVLPIGIVTHEESGTVEAGTASSAPAKPMMLRKIGATTVVAFLVWLGAYYVIVHQPDIFDNLPFLPNFEDA